MTGGHWTDAREGKLRELWLSGASASQIAGELGCTRNAVIGKVHRLKIDRKAQLSKPERPRKVEPERLPPAPEGAIVPRAPERWAPLQFKPRSNTDTIMSPRFSRKAYVRPTNETFELPTVPGRFSILMLEYGECRYPMGDPGHPEFGFCARPVATNDKHCYCAAHARLCYQTVEDRKTYDKKLMRLARL